MTPPSMHEAKYLVELGSILPNGRVRWRTSVRGGFRDEEDMLKCREAEWSGQESSEIDDNVIGYSYEANIGQV
jgi:hypothetical protein